jgi:hypothetical protein
MSARDILLSVHVAASLLGLPLGLVAMLTERPPDYRSRAGTAYVWAVIGRFGDRGRLVALDVSALWWLWPLAALTCALALVGYRAPSRRGRGWVRAYAHGLGGAYIALVTALIDRSLSATFGGRSGPR